MPLCVGYGRKRTKDKLQHLQQKNLSTMFTQQPVKPLADQPIRTQEAERHVQVVESYISLSPSQTAGPKL